MNIRPFYVRKFPPSIAALAVALVAMSWALPAIPAAGAEWEVVSREELPSPGAGAALWRLKASSSSGARAEMVCLVFNGRQCQLRVIDRPEPSSPKLGETMRRGGFLAGVNGGFFDRQFAPLGWVASGGKEISPPLRAKLLTGAFHHDGRRGRISRMTELRKNLRAVEALQSGPFLVDDGSPAAGLEATRPAARTFLATDGADRWAVGVIFSPTLAGAADLLATAGLIPGFRPQRALNLDGGRSTGFWARQPDAAPIHFEEISDVRNYLAVAAREGG